MSLRFFDYSLIRELAKDSDELVLLCYGAMFKGCKIANNWLELRNRLFLGWLVDKYLLETLFPMSRDGIYPNVPTGRPYNIIAKDIFYAKIPSKVKADYIRLVGQISNHQRWNYKLWKIPIYIPHLTKVNPDIPKEWVEIEGDKIRIKMEENYYG